MSGYLGYCNCGVEGCPYGWVIGEILTRGLVALPLSHDVHLLT